MLELDDLRTFVEVVETGGFGRAAECLGISKSIVSRRVARLESDLDVQLLSRTPRGTSPTDAGLDFKIRADRILADLEDAKDAMRKENGLSGRLRIAAPLTFGVHHVAPLLGDLARQHPELEIDVSYSDRMVDLMAEGLDAAIRIGILKDSSLISRRIASVHSAVVGSPAYFEQHGIPVTPSDLATHECIHYSGTSSLEWRFRVGQRWVSVRPKGRLRADSGEAILRWVEEGLGVAAIPSFLASQSIGNGSLIPVLTEFPMPEISLHVVRPHGRPASQKVRVFIDAAVERFSKDLSWDPCREAQARLSAPPINHALSDL